MNHIIYKGYGYDTEIELEDDNRKMYHIIVDPAGRRLDFSETPQAFLRISPYDYPTQAQFESAVDELIGNE